MKVGFGYDVHKIGHGGRLIIGGIVVSEKYHSVAHSDGDVLCHAIADALLGVAGFGDIGELFPENEKTKDMSSINALNEVVKMVRSKGFKIINVDAVVVFSKEKLSPYREAIVKNMSGVLGCEFSVKFKSGNGVGEVGEGRAIESYTAVLVEKL